MMSNVILIIRGLRSLGNMDATGNLTLVVQQVATDGIGL
ncbi:hypothetical protein N507_1530 [Lacticaseibacillus rhamnosus DSM 14870]|nr:hypothetical protein N507_1530 [Lacticaseibacillus rhamnosus DSM 14870]